MNDKLQTILEEHGAEAGELTESLKQAIKQLIEEERELAIYSYRSDILADNYDSELGTYDFDGIAEKVVELGKDSFKRLAEYDGESNGL